jgi:hypothetical protein
MPRPVRPPPQPGDPISAPDHGNADSVSPSHHHHRGSSAHVFVSVPIIPRAPTDWEGPTPPLRPALARRPQPSLSFLSLCHHCSVRPHPSPCLASPPFRSRTVSPRSCLGPRPAPGWGIQTDHFFPITFHESHSRVTPPLHYKAPLMELVWWPGGSQAPYGSVSDALVSW